MNKNYNSKQGVSGRVPLKFSVKNRYATGTILKEDESGVHVQWDSFPGQIFVYPHESLHLWTFYKQKDAAN